MGRRSAVTTHSGNGYNGTECVVCKSQGIDRKGVTTRLVKAVGYNAWVCSQHKKD